MTIEQAIQQKIPFSNEWQRAMVNLIYTANWVNDQLKLNLKQFDITPQQYNVMRILRGAGKPISTSDIRDRLLDKMSDASRMVDRLCQKGWVVRTTCPNDKRLVDVKLTDEGTLLLLDIDNQLKNIETPLIKLSSEEANTLNILLDKARND